MKHSGVRGEVWFVSQDVPTIGSELAKDRPCVIVQPSEMSFLRTTIVAPLTSKGFETPFRLRTSFGKGGLILLDHIRAIDRARLRRFAGTLDAAELSRVLGTLQAIFAP